VCRAYSRGTSSASDAIARAVRGHEAVAIPSRASVASPGTLPGPRPASRPRSQDGPRASIPRAGARLPDPLADGGSGPGPHRRIRFRELVSSPARQTPIVAAWSWSVRPPVVGPPRFPARRRVSPDELRSPFRRGACAPRPARCARVSHDPLPPTALRPSRA
jgi:hypothetical protein